MFIYTIDENPPLVKKIRLIWRDGEPRAAFARACGLPNRKKWAYNQIYRELEIVTKPRFEGKQRRVILNELRPEGLLIAGLFAFSRVTGEHT
jgi:hypothetical protein